MLNSFRGKRVFVTGHTGFKGSWLSTWLLHLGAEVWGYSREIPTDPGMFDILQLGGKMRHAIGDVRDIEILNKLISACQPDFIFHLAAQPIVSESYSDPLNTLSSNIMGTANVLECTRTLDNPCNVVIITSDKCYENVEWVWGYRETDQMGGKDIYSASKGAAELVFHAYFESFLKKMPHVRFATARAGNVIGGGDWAKDRIIADCVRAWSQEDSVTIRCPRATRPWQHVLEPLSGYLTLAASMADNAALNGERFNFGPKAEQDHDVERLICDLATHWDFPDGVEPYQIVDEVPFNEAGLLKLNCDKALAALNWQANLDYQQCIDYVGSWYQHYYQNKGDMHEFTLTQIKDYEAKGSAQKLVWSPS